MSNQIVIFSLESCFHCASLKKRLKNENIQYIEIDIDTNQNMWDQVVNQTGHNVVPSVFISKEEKDDGPIYIPGKDFEDEDTIVNIIKTYV